MKMKCNFFRYALLLFVGSTMLLVSCVNDSWSEHYSVNPDLNSNLSLWGMIQKEPSMAKFAWALRKTSYDKVLSGSQMYTVWVPSDSATQNIDTTDSSFSTDILLKSFVQNHISHFSYSATGTLPQRVQLLNNKVIDFGLSGNIFKIGNNALIQKNIIASNGIMHQIGEKIPYFGNIWELMDTESDLDSLRTFFHSNDRIVFDQARSIPGDVNEEGKTVYLDSVLYNFNSLFYSLGSLNNEDSTYSVIMPNNHAWTQSYNNIKEFYRFYYSNAASKYTADTIQRKLTMNAIVKDIVFRNKQVSVADSLLSTNKNRFYKPFDGSIRSVDASNGKIYVMDTPKFKPWQSWHKEIRVEAEKTNGRINTYSTLYERTYSDTSFAISNNKYIDISASQVGLNPTVTFDIPNTLSGKLNADSTIQSGGTYNIYCVFAPNSLKTTTPKPSKVIFTLSYQLASGIVTSKNFTNKTTNYVTNTDKMTKVLVAENFAFPVSEYKLETPYVKLKVSSNVTNALTTTYTRDLLIDCIILEPVQK